MYLGSNGKYQFHSLEVHMDSNGELQEIAKACEKVEKEVWNAGENFFEYLKRQSALIYAKHEDQVVAFALFDISTKNNSLVFSASECMVTKRHQGNGLPTLFLAILISHIRKDNKLRKNKRPYKSVSFVSSTVSFKLMKSFRHYGWLAKKDSFHSDKEIQEIASDYIKKENWKSLPENLFFIEAAFPNAVKMGSGIEKPDFVPKSFLAPRGDAFLYVCRITNFTFLGLASRVVLFKYNFQFSKNILNISRIIRDHVIYTSVQRKNSADFL